MATRGSPPWEPPRPDADTLPAGIALLDEILSGKGLKRDELSIFVAGVPLGHEKTTLWRQLMEKHGGANFDFEAALDPEITEQVLGRAKPPDGDNTT